MVSYSLYHRETVIKGTTVKAWTTVFHHYTAECREHVEQKKHTIYRPMKALQSGCLSLINVTYLIAGGESRDGMRCVAPFLCLWR
jgi:hypothetical protein